MNEEATQKNSFFTNLTAKEICNLERKIQSYINAIHKLSNQVTTEVATDSSEYSPYSDGTLDKLLNVFYKSALYDGPSVKLNENENASSRDHQIKKIKQLFIDAYSKRNKFVNENTVRIIFPIYFYALIINNETNDDTKRKQYARPRKSTGWGIANKVWEVSPTNRHSNRYSLRDNLMNQIRNDAGILPSDEECDFLWSYNNTNDILASNEGIISIEEAAKRSSFIGKILLAIHDESRPLDTLLRLYAFNKIDHSISTAYEISKETGGCENPIENLIERYCIDLNDNSAKKLDQYLYGYRTTVGKHRLRRASNAHSDEQTDTQSIYSSGYERIKTLAPVNSQDMLDLISHYFDFTVLEWYQTYYTHVQEDLSNKDVPIGKRIALGGNADRVILASILELKYQKRQLEQKIARKKQKAKKKS